MDKLEQLSAAYDGELSSDELKSTLKDLSVSQEQKDTLHGFGIISDVMQRQPSKKTTSVTRLLDFIPASKPFLMNGLTAAATVLLTLSVIYFFEGNRFNADQESTMMLSSALGSEEAKQQLLNADQNIMEHMIHIMQSNDLHESQALSSSWIPVGYSSMQDKKNHFSNGKHHLYLHVEKENLGISKVRYLKANNHWVYLIPLKDGRLLTAYGDAPPIIAQSMIEKITRK